MAKRPAPSRGIIAWMRKENRPTEETVSGEPDSKVLKLKSLRVCLEPIDNKDLNQKKKSTNGSLNKWKKKVTPEDKLVNEKTTSKKENQKTDNQNQDLRRSSRNLPSNEKVNYKEPSVEREPDIEDLPPIKFKGCIHYYNDFYDIASICDKLLTEVENSKDSVIPIGFDLEWPFSFQTGSGKTALAQICLSEKDCYLLHLYKLKKLPTSFIILLSHSKVKLVGVNIKNDVWKLTRDFNEFPGQKVVDNNCLDCGPYANSVLQRSCRWSLERLTAYLLNKRISKDPSVRRSKWHIEPLSDTQKLYAATDAYVSLLLHLTIEQKKELIEAEEALIAEKESQN